MDQTEFVALMVREILDGVQVREQAASRLSNKYGIEVVDAAALVEQELGVQISGGEQNKALNAQRPQDEIDAENQRTGRLEAEREVIVEKAAEAAHEANRQYCISLGDDSQVAWADAPDWQKDSARNGVRFLMMHPEMGPADQHENWMAIKLEQGWTYGAVKDVEAKTHPCLVPYDQLPPEQQAKDQLFRDTVMPVIEVEIPKVDDMASIGVASADAIAQAAAKITK